MFRMLIRFSFISILLIMTIPAGCSNEKGIGNITVCPDLPQVDSLDQSDPGRAILGVYHVIVDAGLPSAEIIPMRNLYLDMHVDLIPYLCNVPCQDCLRLQAIGLDSNKNLLMDFAMIHPFQDPSIRPDLNGFDLRGIIVLPGDVVFPYTAQVKAVYHPETHQRLRDEEPVQLNPGVLVNADGYTAIFDIHPELRPYHPKYIAGNVNPYIDYFWEDNPDPIAVGNIIPWHTFAVGGGWDVKRYVLDTKKLPQTFEFDFIADVSYGQSATWQTRQNPFYRNPQFNRKEAYEVKVFTDNQLVQGDPLSYCDLTIRVKDWQAGAPIVQDPLHPGQNEVDFPSDVQRVTIEALDLQSGLLFLDNPDSGSGSESDPYIFLARVRNLNQVTNGTYPVLISVVDQLNTSNELDLRTFQVVMLEVGSSHQVVDFNAPEQITANEHESFVWPKECIAIDSSNVPHVVWTDNRTGAHQVYYSKRVASGVWSNPENISQSSDQAFYPTIAIDSQDKIHITWEDTGGMVEGMNIRYGDKTGAGLNHDLNLTNYDEGVYGYLPRIVIDPSDEAHITWYDNEISNSDVNFDIRYVEIKFPGGTPTPGTLLEVAQTTYWEGQPAVAIDASENPLIGFVRFDGQHRLFFSKMDGGTFIEPTMVNGGPAYYPDIDYASTGAIVIAYHGGALATSQIWMTYSTNDGSSWAAPSQISTSLTADQVHPDIVLGSSGIIHVFWHEIDPDTQEPLVIHYRQSQGGLLSDEQMITPTGYPAAFPSAALDSDDELHVAFQAWIDSNYEIFYMTSRD